MEVYNRIDLLERGMTDLVELKRVRDTLKEELKIVREKVQNSRSRMKNLKNSSQVF